MNKRILVMVLTAGMIVSLGYFLWTSRAVAQRADPGLAGMTLRTLETAIPESRLWYEGAISRDDPSHPLNESNDALSDGRAESSAFVYDYAEAYAVGGVVDLETGAGFAGNYLYRYADAPLTARAAQAIGDATANTPGAREDPSFGEEDHVRLIMFPGSEGTVLYCRTETKGDVLSLLIVEGADQVSARAIVDRLTAPETDQ